MVEVESSIGGLKELDDALAQFPLLLQKKVLRGALRAGQKVILDQAKANVHSVSGELAKSLRISTRTINGVITAQLKAGNKKAFYAYMVEFGTAAHYIQPKWAKALGVLGGAVSKVHHPGAKKMPFMRLALDAKQAPAIDEFAAYMTKRIDKENIKMLAAMPDETDQVTA